MSTLCAWIVGGAILLYGVLAAFSHGRTPPRKPFNAIPYVFVCAFLLTAWAFAIWNP